MDVDPQPFQLRLPHLSTDVLGSISDWLDINDIVNLFATNSRLLATKLCSSGCVRRLQIVGTPPKNKEQEWKRYLRAHRHLESFTAIKPAVRAIFEHSECRINISLLHAIRSTSLTSLYLECSIFNDNGCQEKFGSFGSRFPALKHLHVALTAGGPNEKWTSLFATLPRALETLEYRTSLADTIFFAPTLPQSLTSLNVGLDAFTPLDEKWFSLLQSHLINLRSLSITQHKVGTHLSLLSSDAAPKTTPMEARSLPPSSTQPTSPTDGAKTPAKFVLDSLSLHIHDTSTLLGFWPPSLTSLMIGSFSPDSGLDPSLMPDFLCALPPRLASLSFGQCLMPPHSTWWNSVPQSLTALRILTWTEQCDLQNLPPLLTSLVIDQVRAPLTHFGLGFGRAVSPSSYDKLSTEAMDALTLPKHMKELLVPIRITNPQNMLRCLPSSLTRLKMSIGVPDLESEVWTDSDIVRLAQHLPNAAIRLIGRARFNTAVPPDTLRFDLIEYPNYAIGRQLKCPRVTCDSWKFGYSMVLAENTTEASVGPITRHVTWNSQTPFAAELLRLIQPLQHLTRLHIDCPTNHIEQSQIPFQNLQELLHLDLGATNLSSSAVPFASLSRRLISLNIQSPSGIEILDTDPWDINDLPRTLERLSLGSVRRPLRRNMILARWPSGLQEVQFFSEDWRDSDVKTVLDQLLHAKSFSVHGRVFTDGSMVHDYPLIDWSPKRLEYALRDMLRPALIEQFHLMESPLQFPRSCVNWNNAEGPTELSIRLREQLPTSFSGLQEFHCAQSSLAFDMNSSSVLFELPSTLRALSICIYTFKPTDSLQRLPRSLTFLELFVTMDKHEPDDGTYGRLPATHGLPPSLVKLRAFQLCIKKEVIRTLPNTLTELDFWGGDEEWTDTTLLELRRERPLLRSIRVQEAGISGAYTRDMTTDINTLSYARLVVQAIRIDVVRPVLFETCPLSFPNSVLTLNLRGAFPNSRISSLACFTAYPANLLSLSVAIADSLTAQDLLLLPRSLTSLQIELGPQAEYDPTTTSFDVFPRGLQILHIVKPPSFGNIQAMRGTIGSKGAVEIAFTNLPPVLESLKLNLAKITIDAVPHLPNTLRSLEVAIGSPVKLQDLRDALPHCNLVNFIK